MRAPCSVDGCEKESRGRGLCSTHWARWKKHGDPSVVLRPGVDFNTRAGCVVEGCEKFAHAHGFCPMHLERWKKHGDPQVRGAKTGRPLKGDVPTFGAVHKRLARTRGSARDLRCVDCGEPARDWSYNNADPAQLWGVSGGFRIPYSLDLSNYDPRCVSCHRKHDRAGQRPRSAQGQFMRKEKQP